MGAGDGQASDRTDTARRLVVVRVGLEEYGLPASIVRDVVPYRAPRPVPGSSMHVEGVISLRGVVVPVLDLRMSLGAGGARPVVPAIVIVEIPGLTVGIVVDAVVALGGVREPAASRDVLVLDMVRLVAERPLAA